MKAALSSTWNSPNQQRGWVGPGRVPSYDLFEFALTCCCKRASWNRVQLPQLRSQGGSWKCFYRSLFSWNSKHWEWKQEKKTQQKRLAKLQTAQLFQDRLRPAFPRHTVGECALPATSMVLPGPSFFSSSLVSLLIVFYQEFGVSIGPKSKSFTLLLFLCYCAKACQCHALFFENWVL